MIAATVSRAHDATSEDVNEQIRRQTEETVALYAAAGPEAIERRLGELDREWDIERMIEVEAPLTILAGLALGTAVDRRWLVVPAFAAGMVLLHNLHGWYPLLPLLRRAGVRTEREIAAERYALKALRGDFRGIDGEGGHAAGRAFEAAGLRD